MSFRTWPSIGRVLAGAVAGAALALLIGFAVIYLLPDSGDGWADLGVAAFTTVFGIPAGALIGGVVGWWVGRDLSQEEAASNVTETSV